MKKSHWLGAAVLIVVGYIIGVMYPGIGERVKSKISGVTA